MTIFGWDASHWDWGRGPMDIGAAARDGIVFMTHKAIDKTSRNDRYDDFARRAFGVIPLLGAYAVNHPGDQRPQVDAYISTLDEVSPWWRDTAFVVQLDAERFDYMPREPNLTEIRQWCDYFVARTGGRWRPVVYAPRWLYGDRLAGLPYPLWQSNYGNDPAVHYRAAYPGDGSSRWAAYSGQTPALLQYGSRTTIGSQHTCDANAFRGTLEQLRALVYKGGEDDMTPEESRQLFNIDRLLTALLLDADDVSGLREFPGDPTPVAYPLRLAQRVRRLVEVESKVDRLLSRPPVDAAAVAAALAADVAFREALADALAARIQPPSPAQVAEAVADELHQRTAD